MLVVSKFLIFYLTIINLHKLQADETENQVETLKTLEDDLFKYSKFFVIIRNGTSTRRGTVISSNTIVSVPGLSEDIFVCPIDEDLECQKPKSLKQVQQELTIIELDQPLKEPNVFSGNATLATCFEVGADLEPNRVEVGDHFVKCLDRKCGYLETLVCEDKLAGLVANLRQYRVNLFVPIDFIRKAAKKELKR